MPAAGAVVGVVGAAVAVWPTLTLAASVVAGVVVLALRAPEYAFLVSILLFAAEGSLKAMLAVEGTPLGVSTNAVGAVLLDVCLAASVLGLLRHDSRARLKRVWENLPRAAQIALGALAGWIAISAVQALTIGSLSQGLHGFRLVQAYMVVGVLGALLLGRLSRRILIPLLLSGLLVISGYAVFRVISGPSSIEHSYTVKRAGVETYGGVGRAAGSFSAAAGLASYLVPAAVFAFVLALTLPRYRVLAVTVLACSVVGVIGSYVRVGVVALALGLLLGGGLLVAQNRWTRRRRLVLLGVVILAFVAGGLGTAVASRASPDLKERSRIFLDPFADESVRMRLATWKAALEEFGDHPVGTGIGSAGRASERDDGGHVVIDNSYLLILRQQGWLGGTIFIVGVVALLVALAHASLDGSRPFHPLSVAALAGAFAFLMLGVAGEYIEQPGKVLAWLFLGLATLEIGRFNSSDVALADE